MRALIAVILSLATLGLCAGPKPKVKLTTSMGVIVLELEPEAAPKTVENFLKYVKKGQYKGTIFHRVIPGFMIQGGDPNTKSDPHSPRAGTGGPGYTVPAEIKQLHVRGTLATARTGDQVNPQRASSGSQFFINVKDNTSLDRGGYTVFGRVIKGMEVADQIVAVPRDGRDNPDDPVKMEVKLVSRAEAGL